MEHTYSLRVGPLHSQLERASGPPSQNDASFWSARTLFVFFCGGLKLVALRVEQSRTGTSAKTLHFLQVFFGPAIAPRGAFPSSTLRLQAYFLREEIRSRQYFARPVSTCTVSQVFKMNIALEENGYW
eukprot:2816251-Amphidinium_carterae.1